MSKANDRQEGGNHYQQLSSDTKLQHWDLARIFNWDPMQYQITKYVMRWKNKHKTYEERLIDLKKGLHVYQKYVEDAETWDKAHVRLPAAQVVVSPRSQADIDKEYMCQTTAAVQFEPDGYIKDGTRYQCKLCRAVVLAHSPLGASALHTHVHCEVQQQQNRLGKSVLTAMMKETVSGTALIWAAQGPSQSAASQPAPAPTPQLLSAP